MAHFFKKNKPNFLNMAHGIAISNPRLNNL